MSIGNVLIQPQLLYRRPEDEGAQALDLLTGLSSRLLEDFLRGGPASKKITAALEAEANAFFGQFNTRLKTTGDKLLDWIDPYLSVVRSLGKLGNSSSENLLATLEALVEVAGKLIDDLHSSRIADRLTALADIIEQDLGLSVDTLNNFYHDCFDRVTQALSHDFLQGSQSEEAFNNFLISRQLLALRRILLEQIALIPLPDFDRRALIRDLHLQLEASDWDERLDAIREKLVTGPDQLRDLIPLVTQGFSGSISTSSKAFRDSGDEAKQFSWYASWFLGEGTGTADRFSLAAEPFASQINFDPISLGFLEHWAHITFALDEAARALKYGIADNDVGNRVSPILNLVWQSGMGVLTLLAYLVEGKTWVDFFKVKTHSAFQSGMPQLLTIGASFEQFPGFWGWVWATWPHDRGNTSEGMEWPDKAREFFLSLFTVINSNDNSSTKNHEKINGITGAFRTGGAYLAALAFGRKKLYYPVFSGNFGITVLTLMGGGVMTWSFDIIGWLVSGAFAGRLSDRYWKFESSDFTGGVSEFFGGENAYGSLFGSFLEFYGTWGGFWEGRTNDGKFGVKVITKPDGSPDHVDAAFTGYPPKNTSPYRLPFEPGSLVFCSQGHQGFSSHNYFKGQIYAVDFLLNENHLVLAMRDGVVVEYRDDLENGSDHGTNYILIRHDKLNAEHDRGENGQPVTTYARYENSQPFGVQRAFAAMGIPAELIIGTRIQQGFPVMLLGKRPGLLNYDYLQVQVSAGTVNGFLPTIPFVFQEVPENGVPETGKYYGSINLLKANSGLTLLHPDSVHGWVVEAGLDFVKLEKNARDNDDAYKDAYLLVWYELPEGEIWYEYLKIKEYKGGDRKVIIEGNWLAGSPPPKFARYHVGAPQYSTANAFNKRFAYLANRDGSNNAVNFADGRPFYRLMKTGYFHAGALTGKIIGGGAAGANEVHLDTNAGTTNHQYNQRHIIIRRNGQIIQYRAILNYRFDGGIRKVFIDGAWDLALQTGGSADSYEIGALPFWKPPSDPVKAYHAPDDDPECYLPNSFWDKTPPYRYYPFPLIKED